MVVSSGQAQRVSTSRARLATDSRVHALCLPLSAVPVCVLGLSSQNAQKLMQGHPPRLRLGGTVVLLDLTASPAVPPTTRTLTYEPYTRLFGSNTTSNLLPFLSWRCGGVPDG